MRYVYYVRNKLIGYVDVNERKVVINEALKPITLKEVQKFRKILRIAARQYARKYDIDIKEVREVIEK